MNENIHTGNGTGDRSLHFPFEDLMARLMNEGFVLKPDDYIELLKITSTFGNTGIYNLRYRLAPLICTSEHEQERFYQVFDEYAKHIVQKDIDAAKQKRKKIWYAVIIALAVVTVTSLFFLLKEKRDPPPAGFIFRVNGSQVSFALNTDSILVDAQLVKEKSIVESNNYDTSGIHVYWDIGKGWQNKDQYTLQLPPQGSSLKVKLKISSDKYPAKDSEIEKTIVVCNSILSDLVTNNAENLKVGDEITVSPVFRGNAAVPTRNNVWVVNNTDTIRNQLNELKYKIDSGGNYFFQYLIDSSIACSDYSPVSVFVEKESRLEVAGIGAPMQAPTHVNPWLYALLLLPSLIVIIHYIWQQKRKTKVFLSTVNREGDAQGNFPPGPVDIPLENNDLELVTREQEMNTLFRGMRKRVEDDVLVLNISKSIRSEILAAGMPTLIFSQRMKQQEFLVLVDRSRSNSQQLALFDYLLDLFEEESINIERFYFTNFNNFFNKAFPEGMTLQRLNELYRDHVMIIFGTGYQLLDPHIPVLGAEKMKSLDDWEIKAIITPVAWGDWGPHETGLKEAFIVLPADIQGQLLLVQAITEKQFHQENYLRTITDAYRTGGDRLQRINAIKAYLNNDFLFQWLCAIAVYPKLRWEVIVEVGKDLGEANGVTNAVNYTHLLKLVRIPWMNLGFIPESTRLALLKNLTKENEVVARKTILRMLTYADTKFKDDRFFQEEREMQQITNGFLLYSFDKENYPQFAPEAEEFRNRWLKGKVHDGPLVRYLDKRQGDDWPNLLEPTDTDQLGGFNGGPAVKPKKFSNFYLSMGILALAIIAILFFGKSYMQKWNSGGFNFVLTDSSAQQQLGFNFLLDSCTTDSAVYMSGISGSLQLPDTTIPLQFSSWNNATVAASYKMLSSPQAILEVAWDNKRQSANKQLMLASTNNLLIKSCSDTTKNVMQILYNDPVKQDSVQLLANLLSADFKVELSVDSTVSASELSFSDSTRQTSNNIQNWVDKVLQQKISSRSTTGNTSVLRLYFQKSVNWVTLPLGSLPDYLNEVWTGTSNRRLVTFAIPQKRLWYSTGNSNTYGTYRIEEAETKDNVVKLVVSGDKEYRVFFLQNIRAGSFQLCLVGDVFGSVAAARHVDISACTRMEAMMEYYPGDANSNATAGTNGDLKFYFPLRNNLSLAIKENNRLLNADKVNMPDKWVFNYNRNIFFNSIKGSVNGQNRIISIKKMLKTEPGNEPPVNNFTGTPFDRDYISIHWLGYVNDYNQTKASNNPAQQSIPDTPAAKQSWQFLIRLDIERKSYKITKLDKNLFTQLGNQLKESGNAKIKIIGYYTTAEQKKEAEYTVLQVANELKNYGINNNAGRDKVTTIVLESTGSTINQVIQISTKQQQQPGLYVDLYGISISLPASGY